MPLNEGPVWRSETRQEFRMFYEMAESLGDFRYECPSLNGIAF